jgi:predicted site-specific integrase-resolvase
MEFISAEQTAKKWGVSAQRVREYCREGRIDGAKRFGLVYMIPDDAKKPKDARIKSGKYIKRKGQVDL